MTDRHVGCGSKPEVKVIQSDVGFTPKTRHWIADQKLLFVAMAAIEFLFESGSSVYQRPSVGRRIVAV